ncbi:ferredoxin--NADP reductase [Nocardioides sp. JQ2195]|uniref:ferredoxin--NADP reductase n=1 Tax=Nocardioides sp. JQ2195 TaxID=2592334 RepID=UPI00143E1E71|nr:ferredoxin--NADP reductase [Nocardioides sp. JQ2195]QIX26522.1 ferredoxin--NADP reductase [Nocardioides sp. JQ2195]
MSRPHTFQLRVTEVIHETADAHSLVLQPRDEDAGHFDHRPGQFLTLSIPTDREGGAARCYSLSSAPVLGEGLKITVKRTADGYGSNWVCDHLAAGDEIEVLAPSGTFTPRSLDGDFLLVAGGSGVTPVMSILKSVLHAGSGRVALIYANRDEQSVIFRDELIALEKQYRDRLHVVHLLESVQGLPSLESLTELATPYAGRQVFICGPTPFMDAVTAAVEAAGCAREHVHHEKFLSLGNDPFDDVSVELDSTGPAGIVEVELDGRTTELAWPRSNKMLDVFLEAGLDAPFSCKEGNCSACACIVLEGEVEMEHNEVLEAEDIADGIVLACQAIPLSDRVRITYDQ